MLGMLGLMGVLLAGLMMDLSPAETPADDDTPEPESKEIEASAVSTDFMDEEAAPPDPADTGGTEPDGLPKSDDLPDEADPSHHLVGGADQDDLAGAGANDTLEGAAGADVLSGRAGDDQLNAGEGNDRGEGGEGQDTLAGGDGEDSLWGDTGDDTLWGDLGDDALSGGAGNDRLDAGEGSDDLQGGEGYDSLSGEAGDDTLSGGAGADLLSGGAGQDELDGGTGADTLHGDADGAAVDFLNGGEGDDLLFSGAGDYVSGGEGHDAFALQDIQPGDPLVQITDFDPAEDELVVLYDATLHPSPQLSLREVPGSSLLLLDGVPLASLTNGAEVDLSQVQLRAA